MVIRHNYKYSEDFKENSNLEYCELNNIILKNCAINNLHDEKEENSSRSRSLQITKVETGSLNRRNNFVYNFKSSLGIIKVIRKDRIIRCISL